MISYFYGQNAALPPPAARAQTWKETLATTNISMAPTAAVDSAQDQLGSALLVFLIQLATDFGSKLTQFVPQKAVAMRVSGKDIIFLITCFHRRSYLAKLPWQLS